MVSSILASVAITQHIVLTFELICQLFFINNAMNEAKPIHSRRFLLLKCFKCSEGTHSAYTKISLSKKSKFYLFFIVFFGLIFVSASWLVSMHFKLILAQKSFFKHDKVILVLINQKTYKFASLKRYISLF